MKCKIFIILVLQFIMFVGIKICASSTSPNYELINVSGQALSNEIESEGSTVIDELNSMLQEYEKMTSSEDVSRIVDIKNSLIELIDANRNKKKTNEILYRMAYSASIAYMYLHNYNLSAELLTHLYHNKIQYSKEIKKDEYNLYYVPIHRNVLYHSKDYLDYHQNIKDKLEYESKDNSAEEDCYYSIGGTWGTIEYNYTTYIVDRYDFDKESAYSRPIQWVCNIMVDAIEIGLAIPYFIRILKQNPHIKYQYTSLNSTYHTSICSERCSVHFLEKHSRDYTYFNENYHKVTCIHCYYSINETHNWVPHVRLIKGYICKECRQIKLN